jgi:AraC family transcriptional regulator, exoenzyme S synthesis regulatory protein ExsA
MEYPGVSRRVVKGRMFVSCKRERHYSRELMLDQHALVYIYAGTMEVAYANQTHPFGPGTTVLIPRHQLGRLTKLPANGEPFRSLSIMFPEDLLRKFYASRVENPMEGKWTGHLALGPHPLLESVFHSLLPYFELQEELPEDLTDIKIAECLTVLDACNPEVKRLLSAFHEPGKVDLAEYMEQNFMYNLPLEKFGYLTGRSLTTFKKDFQKVFKTTPGRWLIRKRLEHAHYQLSVKKRKPTEIFMDAGFENLSHFSYAFKKQFGYNPTEVSG